jgi:putative hydroxymethylpyrimidine transport system substrate-binding protein
MKVAQWVVASLAVAALLVGCGEGSDAETARQPSDTTAKHPEPPKKLRSLELTLDGYPNAEHAGIFVAKQRGYFEDAGLDLSIHIPVIPRMPMKYVVDESVQLAISYQPQVVLSKQKGVPVVPVRSIVSQPTTSLIWLKKSQIDGIGDLAGKTIATAGLPYQESLLETILAKANLSLSDVKVINADHDLLRFLEKGRADAIVGGSWNVEGIELRSRGLKPVVTPVTELGVPSFEELVLVARPNVLRREGDKIRAFTAALTRGTEAAIENPEAAAEAILAEDQELQPEAVKEEVEATLPLLSKNGEIDRGQWRNFASWLGN